MFILDFLFRIVSKLPIFSFFKLIILVIIEISYNTYRNLSLKPKIDFKPCRSTKNIIITGGTKGIGLAIVTKLLSLNYNIIILARDVEKMKALQNKYGRNRIQYHYLDLTQPSLIKNILNKFNNVNIEFLINNAGVYHREIIKKYGIELNLLANYYSHYLIVKYSKPKKIINISSSVIYTNSYLGNIKYDLFMTNYSRSKLANVLHTLSLKSQGFDAVAVHPGIVCTNLFDNTNYGKIIRVLYKYFWFIFTKVEDAADNVLFATFDNNPEIENVDFYMYFRKCKGPSYINKKIACKLSQMTNSIERRLNSS